MTSAHNSITNLQGHLLNELPFFLHHFVYIVKNKLCIFEKILKFNRILIFFIKFNIFHLDMLGSHLIE